MSHFYPIKLDFVHRFGIISTTVRLLYILPGSTLRLPHDFGIYCLLIILPVEVAIDTLIKTTPTAIMRGSRFVGILYRALTVQVLVCIAVF